MNLEKSRQQICDSFFDENCVYTLYIWGVHTLYTRYRYSIIYTCILLGVYQVLYELPVCTGRPASDLPPSLSFPWDDGVAICTDDDVLCLWCDAGAV